MLKSIEILVLVSTVVGVMVAVWLWWRYRVLPRQVAQRHDEMSSRRGDLICLFKPDTTLTYVNDAYCRHFGRLREELVGRSFLDLIPEPDREATREIIAELMRQPHMIENEHSVIYPDGRVGYQRWYDHPILDRKGRVVLFQSVGRDVTDRRMAEDALRVSERRLQLALRGTDMGLWDWKVPTGEVYFSDQWMRMLGYEPDELPHEFATWENLVHPDDLAIIKAELEAHLRGDKPDYEAPHRMRAKNGEWLWILTSGKVVERDEKGQVLRVTGAHKNIDAQMRAEEERNRLQEHLRHTQKLEAIGTLATGIAHDFNNLVLAIHSASDLAKSHLEANHPATASLNSIEEACGQATSITQSLLTFAHNRHLEKRTIDLGLLVQDSLNLLERLLPHGVKLVAKLPEAQSPVYVVAHAGQLQQVMMNLTINARDAISAGGQDGASCLTIELGREAKLATDAEMLNQADGDEANPMASDDCAVLRFIDTGQGMPEHVQARVFEPFFTTKSRGRSTGLGLSVVHGIVTDHEGQISVASQSGQGATFTITLPMVDPVTNSVVTVETTPSQNDAAHENILLVECGVHDTISLRDMLHRDGFNVLARSSLTTARQAFARQHEVVDLVVVTMNGNAGVDADENMASNVERGAGEGVRGDVGGDVGGDVRGSVGGNVGGDVGGWLREMRGIDEEVPVIFVLASESAEHVKLALPSEDVWTHWIESPTSADAVIALIRRMLVGPIGA